MSSESNRPKRPIHVIDPAVRRPELEAFNRMAATSALPLTYHLPALHGHDSLHHSADDPAGIVVLGSLSSVNDGLDWQKTMNEWLRARMEKGVPTLGICYGHQLIAHLHGAKVGYAFADQTKHVGLRKIRLAPNELWGEGGREGAVAVSHCEEVKECPSGFAVVGHSPEVKIEALAHSRLPLWSFQCHPEATPAFFRNRGIDDPTNGECLKFGHSLVQAFLDYVARRK